MYRVRTHIHTYMPRAEDIPEVGMIASTVRLLEGAQDYKGEGHRVFRNTANGCLYVCVYVNISIDVRRYIYVTDADCY